MVLLYNPRSTFSQRTPLPMSLLAVASTLGERDVEIVDGNCEPDPVGRIIASATRNRPTAIGVTVMPGPQLNQALPDTRRLKAALPDVPIVWGGYFPSQHATTVLHDDAVDYCVVGQGERAFPALLDTLDHGGALSSIPGLVYRDAGAVRDNGPAALEPLDPLPQWPYDRLPMERYLHTHYLGRRVGAHHSSYGCAFRCNFCGIVPIAGGRWVAESAERTATVLRLLQTTYGMDAVQFHDMDFFISEKRTAEFAERITPFGLTWWALGRIDELMRYADTTWRAMAASGLKMVYCGVESASPERLAQLNKGGTAHPDQALALARRSQAYGIVPEFSFMVGTPPDPMADAEATFEFIRRIKSINPAAEIILYTYTPLPVDGTLWDEARRLGFTYPDTLDEWVNGEWSTFALRRDPRTPWLSDRARRRTRNFEKVLNAFYPTVTDTRLTGMRRALLRGLGSWRYQLRCYAWPLELDILQRLVRYRRPETAGF